MKTTRDICCKCYLDAPVAVVKMDDVAWGNGYVWCWRHEGRWKYNKNRRNNWLRYRDYRDFPPPECPYAAEHVVLREKGNE